MGPRSRPRERGGAPSLRTPSVQKYAVSLFQKGVGPILADDAQAVDPNQKNKVKKNDLRERLSRFQRNQSACQTLISFVLHVCVCVSPR